MHTRTAKNPNQIKTKQNKTTTGLREKRMRGRSKDKDGAAEQQERKAGEKVIFPAMLQDFRMIQLTAVDRQMDVEYVSLSH